MRFEGTYSLVHAVLAMQKLDCHRTHITLYVEVLTEVVGIDIIQDRKRLWECVMHNISCEILGSSLVDIGRLNACGFLRIILLVFGCPVFGTRIALGFLALIFPCVLEGDECQLAIYTWFVLNVICLVAVICLLARFIPTFVEILHELVETLMIEQHEPIDKNIIVGISPSVFPYDSRHLVHH